MYKMTKKKQSKDNIVIVHDEYYDAGEEKNMICSIGKPVHGYVIVSLLVFFSIMLCGFESAKNPNEISAEGTIKRISKLADPTKSDYPDCYYVAEFQIHSVKSGKMTEKVINLAIPGFMQYKYTKYSKLQKGDLLNVVLISERDATQKEKSTQSCDDFNLFENSIYFLRDAQKITVFSTSVPNLKVSNEKELYVSQWNTPLNKPQSPKAVRERSLAIQEDLAKIKGQKKESSIDKTTFSKLFADKTKGLPIYKDIAFWFQKGSGVFGVLKYADRYNWDVPIEPYAIHETLPAIIELNNFLKSKNVDLILVLYPTWSPLAIRALIPETMDIPIRGNAEITKFLLEHDVEVIDLAPEMIKMIPHSEFLLYYYHLNLHPGWETQDLAGQLVAKRLLRYDFDKILDPRKFKESRIEAFDKNYLYPAGLPIAGNKPGTPVMTNVTFYDGRYTENNMNSPVLAWGNSFLAWPKNWAFVTALAKYSQQFSTISHGAGCFTTMLKELLINPKNFLDGKKVMIIPISIVMIEGRKFWNIRQLDLRLSQENQKTGTITVELPNIPLTKESAEIQKIAEKNKVSGKSFFIPKEKPLQIKLPSISRKPDCRYVVNIHFYNDNQVKIQLGKQSVSPSLNSLFCIDTVTFPYENKDSVLKITSVYKSASLFISAVEIVEFKENLKK